MISFRPPTDDDIGRVIKFMRDADKDEAYAAHGVGPEHALIGSLRISDYCSSVLYNGRVLGIFGLATTGIYGVGRPWLLGTDDIDRVPGPFVKASIKVIADMHSVSPMLENWVYSKNKKSIKWLSMLGFKIEPAERTGFSRQYFHRFWKVV